MHLGAAFFLVRLRHYNKQKSGINQDKKELLPKPSFFCMSILPGGQNGFKERVWSTVLILRGGTKRVWVCGGNVMTSLPSVMIWGERRVCLLPIIAGFKLTKHASMLFDLWRFYPFVAAGTDLDLHCPSQVQTFYKVSCVSCWCVENVGRYCIIFI